MKLKKKHVWGFCNGRKGDEFCFLFCFVLFHRNIICIGRESKCFACRILLWSWGCHCHIFYVWRDL